MGRRALLTCAGLLALSVPGVMLGDGRLDDHVMEAVTSMNVPNGVKGTAADCLAVEHCWVVPNTPLAPAEFAKRVLESTGARLISVSCSDFPAGKSAVECDATGYIGWKQVIVMVTPDRVRTQAGTIVDRTKVSTVITGFGVTHEYE